MRFTGFEEAGDGAKTFLGLLSVKKTFSKLAVQLFDESCAVNICGDLRGRVKDNAAWRDDVFVGDELRIFDVQKCLPRLLLRRFIVLGCVVRTLATTTTSIVNS